MNIIQVLDVFESEQCFFCVQELHGNGLDLFELVDRYQGFSEETARLIFRQIVDAVAYCHTNNICHRDIKDENIVVDENFAVKLIDFGSCCVLDASKQFNVFCGTLEYASPEILLGHPYRGPEVEVWAMGVTLYTILFGEHPFFDPDETMAGILEPPFDVSNGTEDSLFVSSLLGIEGDLCFFFLSILECFDILLWMLHTSTEQRATLTDIGNHPWITGIPGPLHFDPDE